MEQTNKLLTIILLIVMLFALMFLVHIDYKNLLKNYNIFVYNFNIGIWDIIINTLVVVVLYYITYIKIDSKYVEQNKNKTEIANLLLNDDYLECQDYIEFLMKKDVKEKIIQKINFNTDLNNEPIFKNLINIPFENHQTILDLSKEGIISAKNVNNYLQIKKEYRKFIRFYIVFYDNESGIRLLKKSLEKKIKESKII